MLIEKAFRIGRVQYSPGSALGPRATMGYEFVRILKGRVQWTYGQEVHEVGPGSFILSQPGRVEHYRWDLEGVTQHDFIHFYLGELPEAFPRPAVWECVAEVEAHDVLHGLFQHIVDLNRSGHRLAHGLVVQALEQMLSAWVLGLHQFEDRGFRDFSQPVQQVLDWMYERWRRNEFTRPPLDELARRAQVSRSTFIRQFQAECGQSPAQFFEHQRLYLGQLHLLESDRTIDQIAWLLQYPNPFHFSRNFKKLFGLSPRAYRAAAPVSPLVSHGFLFHRVFDKLSSSQTI